MYYIISQSGDGDIFINELTSQQMQKEMNRWVVGDCMPAIHTPESFEGNQDPMYWGENTILIIKGEIVVPKATEKITKLEIE